jgi:hypothetical protein
VAQSGQRPEHLSAAAAPPTVETGRPGVAVGASAEASVRAVETMRRAFARAAGRVEPVERAYAFAGRPVRLRVAGRELADQVTGPFDHLRVAAPGGGAALTVELWDEAATGVACPPEALAPPGRSWVVENGSVSASADGRYLRFQREQTLSWLDRQAGYLVEWRRSADSSEPVDRAQPLRLPLKVWYADQGVQLLHAGLVGWNGRGALLVGPGGAGKSTTALACRLGGLEYLGDDAVGLEERTAGAFVGHSLFGSGRLERSHLARFPALGRGARAATGSSEPKSLLLLGAAPSGRRARSVRLALLLLPAVVERAEPAAEPLAGGAALRALAPSTLLGALGAGRPGFEQLARLVKRLPCYRLELGRELDRIGPLVGGLLDGAGR